MMGKNKSGLLDKIIAAKIKMQQQLQSYGKRIRKNIDQGHKDFKSGKAKYYGTINPFK